jgi:hypothetical protein
MKGWITAPANVKGDEEGGKCDMYLVNIDWTNWIHVAESLKNYQSFSCSRISQHFVEYGSSLSYSQEALSWVRTTPRHPVSPKPFLMLSSHIRLHLPSGLFPPGLLVKFIFSLKRSTCFDQLFLLGLIILIIFSEEYEFRSSSLRSFLQPPTVLSLLGLNILLSTLFSNTLSQFSSLNVRDQVSRQWKTEGKVIVPYILIFTFLDSKREGKRFSTERYQAIPSFSVLLIYSWILTVSSRLLSSLKVTENES